MRRRQFLIESGQAARSASLIPFAFWEKTNLISYETKSDPSLQTMIEGLKKLIPRLMKEANLPGLSIALIDNGKSVWQQGFGVRAVGAKERVTSDTLFEAASVSKTVFAYAVLKLCEKGVLDLDTPLTHYVPNLFLERDPRLELITARHVLCHTTGFQDFRSGENPLKIHFKPGGKFRYSGEGYFYLQSVVTHLTGKEDKTNCSQYEAGIKVCATDFDLFMKRTVLTPFGMTSSGYNWHDSFAENFARPHDDTGKLFVKPKPTAPDVARYGAVGGLLTSCSDYARFLIEVIAPKPTDAFRLKKASRDEMLRPQIKLAEGEKIDDADAWSLGWAIRQGNTGDIILHSGGQSGFCSLTMGSVHRRSGFVILTNASIGGSVIFHPELESMLNPLLNG